MDLRSFKLQTAEVPEVKGEFVDKFFRKGRYDDVHISAITEFPVHENSKDKTWVSFMFTYSLGDKSINQFIQVPTVKFTYGEKGLTIPFEILVRFLGAVGVEVNKENAADIIPLIFAVNLKALEGKKLSIEVGYKAHYAAKSEAGIHLFRPDGKPILSEDGTNPEIFPDFTAAESFAAGNNLRFQKFPEVVKIFPPTTPNKVDDLLKTPVKQARKVEW